MFDDSANALSRINRRDFLKITAVLGGFALGGAILKGRGDPSVRRLHIVRFLMGTDIQLTLFAPDIKTAENACAATFAEVERLIGLFDHRISTSPTARLNRSGALQDPPAEWSALLEMAIGVSVRTAGAFDITVKPLLDAALSGRQPGVAEHRLVDFLGIRTSPDGISFDRPGMAITLDGIAKGCVIDGASAELKRQGFGHILVEAGGDLYASAAQEGFAPWKIGIANPRAGNQASVIGAIALQDRAAATSGDYQNSFSKDFNHHHIFDPRSGRSPQELCSVTVLAPTAALADACSTALMVLGIDDGLAFANSTDNFEALLIDKHMIRYPSNGFPEI